MLAKWLRHEASRAPKLEAAAAGRGGRLGHPGRLRRLGRLAPPRIVRSWAWSAERNALNFTRRFERVVVVSFFVSCQRPHHGQR
jgi:hypothetical protein